MINYAYFQIKAINQLKKIIPSFISNNLLLY